MGPPRPSTTRTSLSDTVPEMDSDSSTDIHDCVYHVEEWSRQIKQWIDADRANLELANKFIVGLGLVTVVQGLFLAPVTRTLIPDLHLATNLASLALVIGIGGAFIGVASSMTFYARRETNSILFNDLLQFRSDLVLILGWYEESFGDASGHGDTHVNVGGGGDTSVHFAAEPAIRIIGTTQGQTYLNIGSGGDTKATFGGSVTIDRTNPLFPDRKERIQRAKFFLQDIQRHCCFRSERRIVDNLLDVVRKLSRTPQTGGAHAHYREADVRVRVSPSEKYASATRVNITSVLFQALWFCLSSSSTCFGTSTALFLGVTAPGGMLESTIRFSCFLIFPGVFIFLFFCQRSASPTSFSLTHSH